MRTALFILLVLPSLAPAQPREAAELFPPSTIAYAELRDPAANILLSGLVHNM